MKPTFPSDWRDMPCFLISTPAPLVPYTAGLLKILENRGFWADDDSFHDAYTALYELERCYVSTCVSDLIESNRQIYRLLDTIHNGQLYSASGETPDTISPVIPLVPPRGIVNDNSEMGRSQIVIEALESFIAGSDTPHFSGTPNIHALLQAIIDALSTEETDLGDLLTQLELIAGLLA